MKEKRILFLPAIGFICVAVYIIFSSVLPAIGSFLTLKNGTAGTGTPISMSSNIQVNKTPYYYIVFEYTDEAGNKKIGATTSVYTEKEADAIMQSGQLAIIYNNTSAVQKNFVVNGAFFVPFILSLFFGGAGIFILKIAMRLAKQAKDLRDNGINVLAKFISYGYTETNGEKLYYIELAYKNSKTGKIQLAKTESIFKHFEAEFFKQSGRIKARCYQDTAEILEDREEAKKMLFQ